MVTVDGTGSVWSSYYELYIGEAGNGTLDITGGGVVSNDSSYPGYITHVGDEAGSVGYVTVDGAGSKLKTIGLESVATARGLLGQSTAAQ